MLTQILKMPREQRVPISYDVACNQFMHFITEYLISPGANPEECGRLRHNPVGWISDQGYWIELIGDEYRASSVRH